VKGGTKKFRAEDTEGHGLHIKIVRSSTTKYPEDYFLQKINI
jgi:hypothetical protein